jgi:hypothetical protein
MAYNSLTQTFLCVTVVYSTAFRKQAVLPSSDKAHLTWWTLRSRYSYPLRVARSKWSKWLLAFLPEEGSRFYFRNSVFSTILDGGQSPRTMKLCQEETPINFFLTRRGTGWWPSTLVHSRSLVSFWGDIAAEGKIWSLTCAMLWSSMRGATCWTWRSRWQIYSLTFGWMFKAYLLDRSFVVLFVWTIWRLTWLYYSLPCC